MEEHRSSSPDVHITRDWTRPKPFQVENTDPGKAYRWVNRDNLDQRTHEGWVPTRDENIRHHNPEGCQGRETSEYREMVLCEMPREKAEARNQYARERARQALESSERLYYQQAQRLGFRTDV